MNDRLDIPGVPPDWPHDPAASAPAPEWFHELIAERGGPAPIIAISTADTPGSPSIYDGGSVVEQVAQLYERLADLPPVRYAPSTGRHACQDPDCEHAHPDGD